jgi:hypothetical protein
MDNQRVEKWTENVLDAVKDKDLLSARLSRERNERDRLADELAKLDRARAKPNKPTDLDAEAERIASHLWTLADDLHRAEAARIRELLAGWLNPSNCGSVTPRGANAARPLFAGYRTASCTYVRIPQSSDSSVGATGDGHSLTT